MFHHIRRMLLGQSCWRMLGTAGLFILCSLPAAAYDEGEPLNLADMNQVADWRTYLDPAGTVVRLRQVEGETPDDKAMAVTYEFRNGAYAILTTHGQWDLGNMNTVHVRLKGSGHGDNLELKFTDANGVVFMVRAVRELAKSDWHDVVFHKEDFKYTFGGVGNQELDWKSIRTIDLVLVTNDAKIAEPLTAVITQITAFIETQEFKKQIVVEDFRDYQPVTRYQVRTSPDSSLSFNRSRITYTSKYSLELSYTLGDINSEYSRVQLESLSPRSMNWVTVENISFRICGDGSSSHFEFYLLDNNGHVAKTVLDAYLQDNLWQTVSMRPLDFKVANGAELDWKQIKAYGFIIRSNPGQSNTNNGKVYIEDITVQGEKLASEVEVSPWINIPSESLFKNISFYGSSKTEYFKKKDTAANIQQELPLTVFGNFDQFSFDYEITAKRTDWGTDQGGYVSLDNTISSSNLKISLHKLMRGVDLVETGNLWVDFSRDLFSTNSFLMQTVNGFTWGLKGIRAKGWLPEYGLTQETLYLKFLDDSNSVSNQLTWDDPIMGIRFTNSIVDVNRQYFASTGSLQSSEDLADVLEFAWEIPGFKRTMRLTLQEGLDRYTLNSRGLVDVYPATIINQGTMSNAELYYKEILGAPMDLLINGRRADPNFKPTFRKEPWFYDSDFADYLGVKGRLTYHFGWYYHPYLESENLKRISNSTYYRKRHKAGVDITIDRLFYSTVEASYNDENYYYLNQDFVDKGGSELKSNERTWAAFWKINVFLTSATQLGFEYNYRYVYDRWDSFYTNEQEYTLKGTFYIANNSTINLEQNFKKFRVYGTQAVPDIADLHNDKNFTRVNLKINF